MLEARERRAMCENPGGAAAGILLTFYKGFA